MCDSIDRAEPPLAESRRLIRDNLGNRRQAHDEFAALVDAITVNANGARRGLDAGETLAARNGRRAQAGSQRHLVQNRTGRPNGAWT